MQLSELCGIITPPTNPFNPIITQQVNPFNPLNPLFTYRKQRCSPTDLTDFWVRRINNGFIGLNGFLGASKGVHLSPLGFAACQSKKCTNRAHDCRLLCWRSWDSCTPWRMPFAWLVQLRPLHPLMFVPNRSLEWVLRVLWELTSALWKFLKKTFEPSAKPHANIVQVSAAKKFILEKWKSCFEV